MNLVECEALLQKLEAEKARVSDQNSSYYEEINEEIKRVQNETYANLTPWDRVYLARHNDRQKAQDFIRILFDDFYEMHGDRHYGDDAAIIGGVASFHGKPVTVIAQSKGKTLEENFKKNFGMVNPEGYRKAMRLAKQAEKFKRPIITFVDTAGAYPGRGAEERGQAEAIAQCLYTFSDIQTPVICVVLSEGGSGGALALSIGDRIVMMENAIYSVLSPEGFASILWKDASRAKEASEVMKLTSFDLLEKGVIDHIIKEPLGGMQKDITMVIQQLDAYLVNELNAIRKKKMKTMLEERYEKYRRIGMNV